MTIQELADRAQVTTRTIRYYVEQGVLPPPERGRPAEYTEEHIARLALIKRLKEQYLPLEEIRDTLQRLDLGDLESLVEQYTPPERTQQLDSASDYITTVLSRGQVREQMKQQSAPLPTMPPMDAPAVEPEPESESAAIEPPFAPGSAASSGGTLREDAVDYSRAAYAPPPQPAPAAPAAPQPASAPQSPHEAPQSPASQLWSLVTGKRASKAAAAREERAQMEPPVMWQRVDLGEGIELHYLASSDARFNKRVMRLIESARRILDEDPGNGE
ncbi:MAG: MerR family transcriptional regulator [Chloroflexota bacterium]